MNWKHAAVGVGVVLAGKYAYDRKEEIFGRVIEEWLAWQLGNEEAWEIVEPHELDPEIREALGIDEGGNPLDDATRIGDELTDGDEEWVEDQMGTSPFESLFEELGKEIEDGAKSHDVGVSSLEKWAEEVQEELAEEMEMGDDPFEDFLDRDNVTVFDLTEEDDDSTFIPFHEDVEEEEEDE